MADTLFLTWLVKDMRIAEDRAVLSQIDRIVQSEEFRSAEMLRKLLRYLAQKTLSGDSDSLKEYVIAVECLQKDPSYDPRQNAAVRLQVGRLRQKLGNYYRSEGAGDDLVVDIPKGHFNLVVVPQIAAVPVAVSEPLPLAVLNERMPAVVVAPGVERKTARVVPLAYVMVLCACFLAVLGFLLFQKSLENRTVASGLWTPELQEIWAPIVNSAQPLLLTVGNPLFAEFDVKRGVYYRDKSINDWADVEASAAVKQLRQDLGNPPMAASRYYTAYGSAFASFLLAKKLSPHVGKFTLYPVSELQWSELADNNVIFVGVQNFFFDKQLGAMPLKPSLVQEADGIRDLEPAAGAPAFYADSFKMAPTEGGIVYSLVTHLPGPQGRTDVESFASNRSAGYIAAVQAFTNAIMARSLLKDLKAAGKGKVPRYYQVLFRVRFENGTPTETTCVFVRPLV